MACTKLTEFNVIDLLEPNEWSLFPPGTRKCVWCEPVNKHLTLLGWSGLYVSSVLWELSPYQYARSWAPISVLGLQLPYERWEFSSKQCGRGSAPISALGVGPIPLLTELSSFSALEVEPLSGRLELSFHLCGRNYHQCTGSSAPILANQTTTTNNNLSMLFINLLKLSVI